MPDDPQTEVTPRPKSSSVGALFLSALGGLFLLLALYLALTNFWAMGNRVPDAVAVNGFVTQLSQGQERNFGYGDEPNQSVDVPFQNQEMSNVSFAVSRDAKGGWHIKAVDDEVYARRGWLLPSRERLAPGESGELYDGDRVETRGPLGRANFAVEADGGSGVLRLRLARPLFYEIRREADGQNHDRTQVVFGPAPEPIPSAYDELLFRTRFPDGRAVRGYHISTREDHLRLFDDPDLSAEVPAPAAPPSGGQQQQQQQQPAPSAPVVIWPGDEVKVGTLLLGYRHFVRETFGYHFNTVKLFAVKLAAAILLAGLAFLVGPHVRWPHGFLVYGCACLFVSVSLVLSGRDALFPPHSGRFADYLGVLYFCVLFLCMLRVPATPGGAESSREDYLRVLALYPVFLVIYLLVHDPLTPTSYGVWEFVRVCVKVFFFCAGALVAAQVCNDLVGRLLRRLSLAEWSPRLRWKWLVGGFAVVFAALLFTWSMGGQEALPLAHGRIHLPTLLLPAIVVWTALHAGAAEEDEEIGGVWLAITAFFGLGVVAMYWVFSRSNGGSGDNGGSSILAAGLFISLWLSTRKKLVPALLALVLAAGVLGMVWLSSSPRFGLAWGGREVGILYYDQAKNLRLARDMARAGGRGLDLLIPAEVRSNIHNDLVTAFVVGYFGLVVAAFVFLAFFVFYYYVFEGLKQSFAARQQAAEAGEGAGGDRARALLAAASSALVLTFALQALWMITASLERVVPLTGLDLQPVSVSTISVVSFFVVLLGAVTLAHTHNETLP